MVSGITLFFLVICATVGISTSTPPTPPSAEAAYETVDESQDPDSPQDPGAPLVPFSRLTMVDDQENVATALATCPNRLHRTVKKKVAATESQTTIRRCAP